MAETDNHTRPAGGQRLGPRWLTLLPVAGILAIAVGVRLAASTGDLWLDEIWSLSIASLVSSSLEIFTHAKIDNNHFLNTWVLYHLGPGQPALVYRLPAVAAGVGTVAMAGLIGGRHDRTTGLISMLLFAVSHAMVLYSSEARGYAYVCFFALVSYDAMLRLRRCPGWEVGSVWVISVVLGFLAHLSFAYCYLALLGWSAWFEYGRPNGWKRWLGYQAVPVAFLVVLYGMSLRGMAIGSGEPSQAVVVVLQTFSLGWEGADSTGAFAMAAALAVLGTLAAEVVYRVREKNDSAVFLVSVTLVCPGILVLVAGPEVLFPRYFLVAITFWLLALGQFTARLLAGRRVSQVAGMAILTVFLVLNLCQIERFLRLGRGSYRAAIGMIVRETQGPVVGLGSDHDFRNFLVLSYYWPREGTALHYHRLGEWPAEGPEWLLRHSGTRDYHPEERFADFRGNTYRLVRVFPHAGVSGSSWALYRNENVPP